MPAPIRFTEDEVHSSYDADAVHRFWRALMQVDRVFRLFRTCFLGKSSPVHFFWGSFDLAVTRFSGRAAPAHPGGVPALPDEVTREAYSHEVSSAGFWPGSDAFPEAAFYSYAYPPVGLGLYLGSPWYGYGFGYGSPYFYRPYFGPRIFIGPRFYGPRHFGPHRGRW